ncbi:hypothetical protein COY28_03990 [Candidatus Woesearchaeota archaeon CG_4_10_14_0_2_um_filter_57_5]|nr:MAG: hypothetical protein AUJ68_02620 [Candidatus Woesearchaeota archaeon CG1_02_57_44]PIN68493.1 MAG: hypothetical protein COV94_04330 [Candidatus Woesearchaeota archaeon CG11_big_fil_rev_8_21_14_0_20_57_5]PIZ52982.1 MAG: hypothetical protein COY28_03990 [Candidatus Woesearchaeota archaeon CG_4_10_14_0_2_um_filter_57_5]
MERNLQLSLLIVLAMVIATAWYYPQLPSRMDTHWDAQGAANGASGKAFGSWLSPILALVMLALFAVIPRIDPLQKNMRRYQGQYWLLVLLITGYLAYMQALILAWNLGHRFVFTTALMPAFALLFFGIGSLIRDVPRNWFMGIRTPWSLSSDAAWKLTHEKGAALFKAAGILALVGLAFPRQAIWLLIGGGLVAGIGSVAWSYVAWKRTNKKDKR